jgi:hypothetical protein
VLARPHLWVVAVRARTGSPQRHELREDGAAGARPRAGHQRAHLQGGRSLNFREVDDGREHAERRDRRRDAGAGRDARRIANDQRHGDHRLIERSGSWKLVETSKGGPFLFDLASDPAETRDLAGERPQQLASLTTELEAVRARLQLPRLAEMGSHSPAPELDAATEERLRALGYLK